MRISLEHNLPPDDLTRALAGVALAEGIGGPLLKALGHNSERREPTPERYMIEAAQLYQTQGAALDRAMLANVDRWLAGPLRKAQDDPIYVAGKYRGLWLSQQDIHELIELIQSHYRVAITSAATLDDYWSVTPALAERWRQMGIIAPDVQIGDLVDDAFVAGRLVQVLEDGMSLDQMRAAAREFPMSREARLTLNALRSQVSFDLAGGVGYRATQEAGRLIQGHNARRVQDLVTAYREGTLRATPSNRDDLTPEEIAHLGGRQVQGWRDLARELRNRMAADDRARDWERVAVSSLRQSANIGSITAMAEDGSEYLYYDVHRNACGHCKTLYLEADGTTPKVFPVEQIMQNVLSTGGANYGRSPTSDDPDRAWLPNALAHPWCQCRPRRVIPGVTPKGRR
jgi:hypothetical protein